MNNNISKASMAALEARIAELERQVSRLIIRDREQRDAELSLAEIGAV